MNEQEEERELEQAIFSKSSIRLRNIAGFLAVVTTCICAIFNSYTVHISVAQNGKWVNWVIAMILNVGPIICAFTYLQANKTINTIIHGAKDLATIRQKVADVIAPNQKPPAN